MENFINFFSEAKTRGLPCTSVLDIGANASWWSRSIKHVFPEANFYLIEPQIEMEEQLKKFCEEFPGSKYFIAGAGAKKDTLVFTVTEDTVGSNFLWPEDGDLAEGSLRRKVEILTVDSLLKEQKINMPEIVKIDTQGFELEVLKGAETTFGNTELYLVEVNMFKFQKDYMPEFYEVIDFMYKKGYVVYDFVDFLKRPYDNALAQCDIAFVKENGILRASHNWI